MNLTLSIATAFAPDAVESAATEEKHIIRTQRLHMRPIDYPDLDEYVALLSDPEVMKFIGLDTGKVLDRFEIMQMIDRAVEAWANRGWGRWSIFDHHGEFIGFCGFRKEEDMPEILALIHQRFWDQNITTEAAFACIEYGRKVFGFGEIKAFAHPENLRSHRLLDKLGAIYEGDFDFHGIVGSKYTLPQVARASV